MSFWYDYVKPKYFEKSKSCSVDTDSFIVYIKTDYIYKDIAEDIERTFDTSNYKLDRPFSKGKTRKGNCNNEKWIRWKNIDRICWIKSKNFIVT